MALFGFKKNKKEEKKDIATKFEKPVEVKRAVAVSNPDAKATGGSGVLKNLRVTEKVSLLSATRNVYTFNITEDANKESVSQSVEHLYKVHPVKVRILPVPAKRVFVRGKAGVKRGGRKAYVYLKEGEKIDIA